MATTTTDVTVLYEQKYNNLFQLLAQQLDARIPGSFTQGNWRGSKAARAINQIGIVEPQQRVLRNEPISPADVPHDARWVYPIFFDRAVYFDSMDELQTNADPRSSYVQALMAGMRRAQDSECVRAFDETSHTGETGTATTAFPAGNIVAVNFGASGNTGLTVAKLREARRKLLANEVDLDNDQMFAVASATQLDNLLSEITVTSRDFNADAPVLQEGKITRYLGIDFIHSERLGVDGSSYRKVFVWTRSGMHFGTWQDPFSKITQREDLRGNPWQLYVQSSFGATRFQEKKIMEILCSEA